LLKTAFFQLIGSRGQIVVSNSSRGRINVAVLAIVVLLGCSAISLSAQSNEAQRCESKQEFAPVLVRNTRSKVTFKCDQATPLDLIRATGRQTRIPIGVVLGRDPSVLSKPGRSYDLESVDARFALLEAIQGTGYSLNEENHVLVLIAGDLTPRQERLLTQPYSDFKPGSNNTMVGLGVLLTTWMRATIDPMAGFGGSILGSANDERFTLGETLSGTTEEIANRIVSLGSKGMWTFKVEPSPPSGGSTDEVDIEPYQHYSNWANIRP
jgi:hypothetical protein